MGIDMLDFSFRVEKELKVKLRIDRLEMLGIVSDGQFKNMTADHLLQWVRASMEDGQQPIPADLWLRVRQCLASTVGVKPEKIQLDSNLKKDLGFA